MGTWKILLVISTYPAQHGSIQTPNPQVLYIKKPFCPYFYQKKSQPAGCTYGWVRGWVNILMVFWTPCRNANTLGEDTVHPVRVTRVKKILQRSRYRGIVNYFTYHFGNKLKINLASLLRYAYPVCDIDWFNVPNTVRLNLSFFNTRGQI